MPPPFRALMIALTWLSTTVLAPRVVHADALRRVEQATGAKRAEQRRGGSRGGVDSTFTVAIEDDDTDCSSEFALGCALGWAMFQIVFSPWTVPRLFDQPAFDRYAAYPFADGPYFLRSSAAASPTATRRALLNLSAEGGYLREGVVPTTVSLRAYLPARFELSGAISLLHDVVAQPVQRATMAYAHLTYRFAQTRRVAFRTGVGARLFFANAPRTGVDLFYGVEGYFARRGTLRVDLHGGTLGTGGLLAARATVGVMLKRVELYAGYDHAAVYGPSHETLSGPLLGARAWF